MDRIIIINIWNGSDYIIIFSENKFRGKHESQIW